MGSLLVERWRAAVPWLDALIPLSLLGFAFERNADPTVTVSAPTDLVLVLLACAAGLQQTPSGSDKYSNSNSAKKIRNHFLEAERRGKLFQ